jgi:hypothetical protein
MLHKLTNLLKKKQNPVSAPLNQLQANAEISRKLRELARRNQKNVKQNKNEKA